MYFHVSEKNGNKEVGNMCPVDVFIQLIMEGNDNNRHKII